MDILKKFSPILQTAAAIGLGLIFMLGCLVFESTLVLNPEKPWIFATTFLLFYSIGNVVFSLGAENDDKYWIQSIIGFLLAVACLSMFAYLISGLGMNEAGSFKWIFIVVTISYLIFMSIVRAIKGIVNYAEKEEWNQPNLRKNGKKK